jgi:hypothetical protein
MWKKALNSLLFCASDSTFLQSIQRVVRVHMTAIATETFGPLENYMTDQPDVKIAIADEAKRIVAGARRSAYGSPENNFERIARFWTAYFQNTGRELTISAADVSPLMRLMKEARLCESPSHRDSFVDLIGYTLTGAEVNKVSAE